MSSQDRHDSGTAQQATKIRRALYELDYDPDPGYARRKARRAAFGLETDKPLKAHFEGAEHLLWNRIRTTLQEPFSEFLGTTVLMLFHAGSIAQSTLGADLQTAPGGNGYGSFLSVPWGCVMFLSGSRSLGLRLT